jgi:phosphoribosylaminoimidazole-succinocarboxamide synthase
MSEGTHVASGKVREIYSLDEETLLLVASDRISVFDVILPTEIPDKGRVLTGLSGFWFTLLHSIVPNHMLAIRDDGRSMECRRLRMLPVEVIVRGYITGSGWKDYQATGAVSGHTLPEGLRESDKLPEPIFTPSTKAEEGHDENITRDDAAALVGEERMREVERVAIELYTTAADYALGQGIIIADTKFEFGLDEDGNLVLGDEALTPDSSRFWPAAGYEPGRGQDSFDKQFVRDYAEQTGWNKTYPGPELPEDVVFHTRSKYIEAFELLTKIPFPQYVESPSVVRG